MIKAHFFNICIILLMVSIPCADQMKVTGLRDPASKSVEPVPMPGCLDLLSLPPVRSCLAKLTSNATEAAQIHRTIVTVTQSLGLDPRAVYFRMIGESKCEVDAAHPQSNAYGLFQLLGSLYGHTASKAQEIYALYRKFPRKSRALIQVEYYLNEYVALAVKAADAGYGCKRGVQWKDYSLLEKVTYLGWGSCNTHALNAERALCMPNTSAYIALGACAVVTTAIDYSSSPFPYHPKALCP